MAQALPFILAGVSVGSKIYGGIQAKKTAEQQAQLNEAQARLASSEAEREAGRKTEEQRKFLARQKMSFLANGVGLGGSAGFVLEDTAAQFQQEIDAIRKSGAARAGFLNKEADISRSTGRAALVSGILDGVTSGAKSYAMFN